MQVELYSRARLNILENNKPVSKTDRIGYDKDEEFVENLRKIATQTPPTARRNHYSSHATQRRPTYPAYTSIPPPTPAGSNMPIYQAGQIGPATPLNRGPMQGFPLYANTTPYTGNSSYSPRGHSVGRRVMTDMSPTSIGSPYSRSFSVDTPIPYGTPRKQCVLSPFHGYLSPTMSIHNSVEPEKIIAGEDVRTTASSLISMLFA